MATLAKGENYFQIKGFPVSIKEVDPDRAKTHKHDLTFIEHYHDFNEIVVITKGSGLHVYKGHACSVKQGDIFLLKEQDTHYFKQQDNISLFNIMYDPKLIQLPTQYLDLMPSFRAFFELEPYARSTHNFESHLNVNLVVLEKCIQIISEMQFELEVQPVGFQASNHSLLTKLFVLMCREFSQTNSDQRKNLLRVSSVISDLETNYNKPWTISDLAKRAHMSENSLLAHFKDATGTSPINYLNQIRIKNSCLLLHTTFRSITEIALECGYSDSNYFSRAFKKELQITPSQYRKKSTQKS